MENTILYIDLEELLSDLLLRSISQDLVLRGHPLEKLPDYFGVHVD